MRIFAGMGVVLLALMPALGQTQLTPAEQAVEKRISSLRSLPDALRAQETLKLALAVRQLPPGKGQALMAELLASHATEGDFGRDTLRQVTDTLVQALRAAPQPPDHGQPDFGYIELASLVVPNTASPSAPPARSRRQCATRRSASGAKSARNGVSTGTSTPDRVSELMPLLLEASEPMPKRPGCQPETAEPRRGPGGPTALDAAAKTSAVFPTIVTGEAAASHAPAAGT